MAFQSPYGPINTFLPSSYGIDSYVLFAAVFIAMTVLLGAIAYARRTATAPSRPSKGVSAWPVILLVSVAVIGAAWVVTGSTSKDSGLQRLQGMMLNVDMRR